MEKIVFTNGCFDIIHPGHIDLLEKARNLGSRLIVGINSDRSVKQIKGNSRPIVSQNDRAKVLQGIRFVDEVIIFDEPTPENLINKLKPDVLVKGGDWKINEIIGADFVQSYGGKVISIPLLEGYSTSHLVKKIEEPSIISEGYIPPQKNSTNIILDSLESHRETISQIIESETNNIERTANFIYQVFKRGNKVLLCGNGGSAADAQHIAAEFVGRFETERRALPAIALTTDTSALTALANDYDFERIFARQVEALAQNGDLLIAISTSGNSANINAAVMSARQSGCQTLGLTGGKGGKLAALCDESVIVPSDRTARIQESHILIAHIWCEIIDAEFAK